MQLGLGAFWCRRVDFRVEFKSRVFRYAHLLMSLEGVIAIHCQQQMCQLANIVLQRKVLCQVQCSSSPHRVQDCECFRKARTFQTLT